MTELALRSDTFALIRTLEESGALTPTNLDLSSVPDLDYETCEALAAFLGHVNHASRWWIASLIIYSEEVHGEAVAQIADATGLAPTTLENISSIGRRVPPSVRRPNLSFSVHAEVASLKPFEQIEWLDVAEAEHLTKSELRSRIRAVRQSDGSEVLEPTVTVEEAARAVWHASRRSVGDVHVTPSEVMIVLKEALGE